MVQSYSVKQITLTIQLGQGNFGGSGFDTVTLSGLRIIAHIESVVNTNFSAGGSQAIIQVYGLTLSQINQLTKAGTQWNTRANYVAVQAGDNQSGMTTVFTGQIYEAYPQFNALPDSLFVINAVVDQTISLKPVASLSFTGTADVATVMGQMAKNAGLTLENNGVSVKFSNPYYPGTTMQQIVSCARAANIFAYIDSTNKTLAIWPKTGSRNGSAIMISAATGMIGYPEFQQVLIKVRSLFNPAVKFGTQIQVQSQFTAVTSSNSTMPTSPSGVNPANGMWNIVKLDYDLSSQTPDGPWEMTILASSPSLGGGGI